jgi:hypothetical protein
LRADIRFIGTSTRTRTSSPRVSFSTTWYSSGLGVGER